MSPRRSPMRLRGLSLLIALFLFGISIPLPPPSFTQLQPPAARAEENADADVIGTRQLARQDEFGVRHEPTLGTPDCPDDEARAGEAHCTPGEWLASRSPNFVNIRKTSFANGTSKNVAGVQMSSSFVVERADTFAAISFSAEAYVEDDAKGLNRRMIVRALIDGVPADPSDVVFASSTHQGVRSFTFTKLLGAGIHTAEIQWKMDADATGYLRDAALLAQTGRSIESATGALYAASAPSGKTKTTTNPAWVNIPDMTGMVYVPANGVLTASLSGETSVTGNQDQRMFVRALVDGAAAEPSDVVFARQPRWQSRTMVFGKLGLTPGWHQVTFQWRVDADGTANIGDRALVLTGYPHSTNAPSHPFVVAPSGPSVNIAGGVTAPIPDMTTNVTIPVQGNGEVAVQFSAETGTTNKVVANAFLVVDGVVQAEQLVTLTDGGMKIHVKHFVFSVKRLTPGSHHFEIWWTAGNGGSASMGDRSMAVSSEVGYVPDLAEPAPFSGGRIDAGYNIGGIEPLIGERNVLTILWDAHRCDDGGTPNCVDQDDLSVADVEAALYGPAGTDGGDNVRDYFQRMSGNRFTINNAGVLGWYDAQKDDDHYWTHPGDSCETTTDAFTNGHTEKLTEAIQQADADFDFSQYDINADGEVEPHELAILLVIPQDNGNGSSKQSLVATQCPYARMQLDGVTLPQSVSTWYTSLDDGYEPFQYTTAAHELMHILSGLDDLYIGADVATYPNTLSLMASGRFTTTHVDGAMKLALGWVTPQLVVADGSYAVADATTGGKVLVLPRYNSPYDDEYFLLENREDTNGALHDDDDILDSGIAVWHIVSDMTQSPLPPIGVTLDDWNTVAAAVADDDPAMYGKGTPSRWGIRLLRSFDDIDSTGKAVFDDKNNKLWDKTDYDLHSGGCPAFFIEPSPAIHNTLTWADCTPSGYHIDFRSLPGASMSVKIEID